jgi:hypothetical protein
MQIADKQKTPRNKRGVSLVSSGRGSGIRTHDLFNPIEARYQAAPCPDGPGIIAKRQGASK